MKCLEEKDTIIGKIKELASTKRTFTRNNLRDAHFGEHLISDWQECLGILQESGYLTKKRGYSRSK